MVVEEEIFDHRKPDHGEGGWVRGLFSGIRFGVWGMGFGVWGLGVEVPLGVEAPLLCWKGMGPRHSHRKDAFVEPT